MSGATGETAVARGRDLVSLFHPDAAAFGDLRLVAAKQVPEAARRLLDHRSHMTVAMERLHGPVRLEVVDCGEDSAGRYAREILLVRADGRVVQHGIVRIDLRRLVAETAAAIRAAAIPLGRILIEAGLLRDVHDVSLLQIDPGPHLRRLFGTDAAPAYGRVATIDLDGVPTVELLEIVAPGSVA
jgi:chorismate-pyruvate lyase